MENNIISEEKIRKEIKFLVQLYLATNASDERLAELTNIDLAAIPERLNDKERIIGIFDEDTIHNTFRDGIKGFLPTNGEEIYEEIVRRRGEVKANDFIKPDKLPLCELLNYVQDEKKQYLLLAHMMLTFRTKLYSVNELLNREIDEKVLKYVNNGVLPALSYLKYSDQTDQEIAKRNFELFYSKLVEADNNKDIKAFNSLIRDVTDYDAKKLKEEHKYGDLLTDDKILIMLRYQLKYALTYHNTAITLGISPKSYNDDVLKYLKENPEYRDAYEILASRNKQYYLNKYYRR